MDLLHILNHGLNFLAPALAVALGVVFFGRIFMSKRAPAQTIWAQIAINFVAGALALGLGLWFFGRDGKMASYAAMLLSCATSQWLMLRLWKP